MDEIEDILVAPAGTYDEWFLTNLVDIRDDFRNELHDTMDEVSYKLVRHIEDDHTL